MKKILYSLLLFFGFTLSFFSQHKDVANTISPSNFNEDETITITFPNVNSAEWGTGDLYLWAWSIDAAGVEKDSPGNGSGWNNVQEANKLTKNGSSYSITFVPKDFFARTGIKSFGYLLRTKSGTPQTINYYANVGKFQLSLTNPIENSIKYYPSNSIVTINATSTSAGNYVLKENGTIIDTKNNITNYTFPYTVSGDKDFELIGTDIASNSNSVSKKFTIRETPAITSEAMPTWMRQGITYHPTDATKVGLALYAPQKDFAYVTGSFNNWTSNTSSLMKKDTNNPNLFWLEISNLTPQQIYTFQYVTSDNIKIADPYSPLILDPDNDKWINNTSTIYPNLPDYPAGQQYDVSVIQTGMPAYDWKVKNFTKPAKENLIVYELLVRDFTTEKTWQSVIDKISYIKGLGVNAIELMPIMEFEGNNSWGYNPSFHYAFDKAYGTQDKFKEFVDTCHENGIAVILDIALNHATQRNSLVRMWSTDTSGGYGSPSTNNPYFNTSAKHAYSVFEDFNHSKPETRYYVQRVVEHWIQEYNIDGFRWDLTKGFTQNCTSSDEGCTGNYQADRVEVLKKYADYQWNIDPSSYVIFEHLGGDNEEKEWANYRIDEGKGVMMWNILTNAYNQNTMGYSSDSNFDRVSYKNHTGFTERRNLAYAESHDEERLMYKNLQYGNGSIKTLNTALHRMKAQGAVLLTVPGPKMIWQFGELGYDKSINMCENGTIGDCRTSPKPSAFNLGYDNITERKAIYDVWAKLLKLRAGNDVFKSKDFTVSSGNLTPIIKISDNSLPTEKIRNIVIVANFDIEFKNISVDFGKTGTWYNVMQNNSPYSVTNSTMSINLPPGEFRIYADAADTTLSTEDVTKFDNNIEFKVMENPASHGEIKVQYDNATNGVVYLYDFSGKFIQSFKLKGSKGQETLKVNGLKMGAYLMQLKAENGATVTKVMVK